MPYFTSSEYTSHIERIKTLHIHYTKRPQSYSHAYYGLLLFTTLLDRVGNSSFFSVTVLTNSNNDSNIIMVV